MIQLVDKNDFDTYVNDHAQVHSNLQVGIADDSVTDAKLSNAPDDLKQRVKTHIDKSSTQKHQQFTEPFYTKNVLTQSDKDPNVSGIGYVSSPDTLAILQMGGLTGGNWFMPFASAVLGKGAISGYTSMPPSLSESMIGCDGTHYLNAMQQDSLIEIEAKTKWKLTSKGLPTPIAEYEYARGAWGINLSSLAFARNEIIYMPMIGQGTPQLRYTCKINEEATGTHYQSTGLPKGDAHVIVITKTGWPCKFVIGAYPASHWYIGTYRDPGSPAWADSHQDTQSPYAGNPIGAGIEWSSAGANNLRTCFGIAMMPTNMTDIEAKDAMINGLANWETEYKSAVEYWESFWSEYTDQWDNIDPEIRSKGLIAVQQIAAQSYKGALPAGTPNWINPGVWIRDSAWPLINIANIVPNFCKEVLSWFANAQSLAGHNSYTLDGVAKDISTVYNTDNSAVFLLASATIWENTHDILLFTALSSQLNAAMEYFTTTYVPGAKHILAKHPHDYWDEYPLYGGEMNVSLVKYESFIDVLWAIALKAIAPVFDALGNSEKANYCRDSSASLILGLEDYRDSELAYGFHYAIKNDGTLYDTVIASPGNIYAARYLNDEGARRFLTDRENSAMLGMKNFNHRVCINFSNYRPSLNRINKDTVWGAHIPLVAGEMAKEGKFELLPVIKDSMPFGNWSEGMCPTNPAIARGLVKHFELAPVFSISLGEIAGLCNTLSKILT